MRMKHNFGSSLKQLLLFGLVTFCGGAFAQSPSWSINPNSFQYSMSATAVLDLNCTELTSPSNRIGAFVNGTLRGTGFTSSVIGGRYQASILVYSNSVSGENVTFRFYEQASNSVYSSIDSVAFQDNAIYGNPALPIVVRTNHRPTQISISSDSLLENLTSGAVVGAFSTIDTDASQTHTYSLVTGMGSTNNALFSISGADLQANFTADFETKTNYTVRVRSTDNLGCSIESMFTVHIKNSNDAPTAISLSSTQVDENNAVNSLVANLNAVDSDANEQFTYSLVSGAGGTDNSAFSVVGNALRAVASFNYEMQTSYSIRLQVSDRAANVFVDTFNVLINNLNEAPTDILLSADTIDENKAINSLVANLSVIDEDAGQNFAYSFSNVPGNDNGNFNLVGNTLRTTATFDYENRNLYFIYITANDLNGGMFTKQISIRVTNKNDSPSDVQLTSSNVAENLPVGSYVGKIITTDQDTGATFVYSLINGVGDANNSNFQISNDSLLTNTVFNVNTQPSQNIRLQVTDNGAGTFQKSFTIVISDINNAPSALFLSNNNIAEATTIGSVVGNFTTSDPDALDNHSYTLVSGAGDADNDDFLIAGTDLKTDTVFDVNRKSQYSIRVRTTDQLGLFFEQNIFINIINSNDAPTDIMLSPADVNENLALNTSVGNLATTDPDVGDTHLYSFANLSANDNASFVIVGNELRTSAVFDFETKSVYFVQIQTTDASNGSFSKQLLVSINDTNDRPTDLALNNNLVDEKQPAGEFVGIVSTSDQDVVDSFTYTLVSGNGATDNASFIISNDSLFSDATFDVLVKSTLSIRVRTTDLTGTFFEKAFTVAVQNVNDAPNDLLLSNSSIPENIPQNSLVGLLNSTDIDPAQTFTYQLVSGIGDADNSNFIITANELKTNTLFDFNTQRSHSIRLRTTDQGGLSFEKQFAIVITNTNDAPTDLAITPNSFNENLPQSSLIGEFSTVDKDSTDAFSYSFVNLGTNDNSNFIISGKELRTTGQFNFENKRLYIIEVQTRDNSGLTFSRQLTLNVLDSNDAPTVVSLTADSIAEQSPVGSFVANLNTTDEDAIDNFTYTLVAGQGARDNALFRINGALLETDSVLNFNNAANRQVRIRTSDKGGQVVESSFVIRVLNVNDLPSDIEMSDTTLNEISPVGSKVGTLSTIDADKNDSFTYSLVPGNGDSDNSSFAISGRDLVSNTTFDFEIDSVYSVRIRTADSAGDLFEKAFTIKLFNGNEKPTIENQLFSIEENAPISFDIGVLTASDMDANEVFSFKIIQSTIDFKVNPLTGMLSSGRSFDYENNSTYTLEIEVTDAGGLKDTATATIVVLDLIETTLPVANYFSPNGDGFNDTWSIQNVELYSDYSLNVFSVNGELVYSQVANYTNDFDGTIGGEQLPEGVYYYILQSNTDSGKLFKGTITLKR